MYGAKKAECIKEVTENLLPNYFKKIEEFCQEGWLIGDGSKIYMCDFFVASIYADLFINSKSWMTFDHRENIKAACPVYVAYAERFLAENRTWM